MAYYVINKNTNKINPNTITGEVALFETEKDFINAIQQWIIDNTIINELPAFDENGVFIEVAPNNSILQQNLAKLDLDYEAITKDLEYETIEGIETIKSAPEGYEINEELGVYQSINNTIKPAPNGYKINDDEAFYIELPNSINTKYIQTIMPNLSDYQYRIATDIEKNEYFNNYLKYKIDNATETSIVVTHKVFQNIENTIRMSMIEYITGQHIEECFNNYYPYIKATGDLLNERLEIELIENEKTEIEIFENEKTAFIQKINTKMDQQTIKFVFYNSKKEITESNPLKTVEYIGLPLLETYNLLQPKISSKDNPVSIETLDLQNVFEVSYSLLGYVNEEVSKNNNQKSKIKTALQSALLYNCDTEIKFTDIINYYKQSSAQDGDNFKDGFITVLIDIATYDIKIYDLTKSFEVLQGAITKEETNVTNEIFKELI